MPAFRFFLDRSDHPVAAGDRIWRSTLPMGSGQRTEPAPTYGEYFRLLQQFLEIDDGRNLLAACRGEGFSIGQVDLRDAPVSIFLVKHGELYHPARVDVRVGDRLLCFVLNPAFSAAGRDALPREFELLAHLGQTRHTGFLPRADAMDTVHRENGPAVPMFIGQWLSGYCEWHWHQTAETGTLDVRLWDPVNEDRGLDEGALRSAFRQMATILTYYYDPVDFEEIRCWHHAAGDFVIRDADADGPRVRLITVRDVGPLIAAPDPVSPEAVLDGLMLFLIRLSLHLRLDRLDGVGELVMAPPFVVDAAVDGFFDGLLLQVSEDRLPEALPPLLGRCLAELDDVSVGRLVETASTRYPAHTPAHGLVSSRIDDHGRAVRAALGRMADKNGFVSETTTEGDSVC